MQGWALASGGPRVAPGAGSPACPSHSGNVKGSPAQPSSSPWGFLCTSVSLPCSRRSCGQPAQTLVCGL